MAILTYMRNATSQSRYADLRRLVDNRMPDHIVRAAADAGEDATKANQRWVVHMLKRLEEADAEFAALEAALAPAAGKPAALADRDATIARLKAEIAEAKAKGLRNAVRVGRGQVDTAAAIRDRLKK